MNRSLLLLLLTLMAPSAAHAVPLQLAHHGQLLDAQGDPITAQESITFRLWDAAEDGNEVWSEVIVVDVVSGHYAALLSLGELGRDVLKTEPSLWLELEVSGETLAPRQPVAATPYALVADTAENLDGGTVNATSISVNGTTVIDAAGAWTGTSGSIDWDALTDVPSGLDDGDADALGGLSCADGDRPVWNAGLGQWDCGSSTVALDRIDTSGAADGQVLAFDGGSAAWAESGSSGSGCTLVSMEGTFAQLDCGGTAVRLTAEEEYVDLASGDLRLRADGTVKDWNGLAPSGTFASVWGRDRVNCAIDAAGAATCWGDPGWVLNSIPAGLYSQIQCWTEACCAILTDGSLTCWVSRGSSSQPVETGIPSGTFVDLAITSSSACAVNSGGTVECWGSNAASLESNAPPGADFEKVGPLGSSYFCAAGPSGGGCWDNTGVLSANTVPPGDYLQVQSGYGLLSNGDVVYFLADGAVVSEEPFVGLAKNGEEPFGLTADGRVLSLVGSHPPGP